MKSLINIIALLIAVISGTASAIAETHTLYLDCNMADEYYFSVKYTPEGGYFSHYHLPTTLEIESGKQVKLETSPKDDFSFVCWEIDNVTNDADILTFIMPDKDVHVKAIYKYSPDSPGSPTSNYFNPKDGILYIETFKPGKLYEAIDQALDYELYEQYKKLAVYGQADDSDLKLWTRYSLSNYCTNLKTIDLSHVWGATTVPGGAFYKMSRIEKIMLPASIDSLEDKIFEYCNGLKDVVFLSNIPPKIYTSYYSHSFTGLPETATVYVPSQTLEMYKLADGWKDLNLKPYLEDQTKFTVLLPQDAERGFYRNLTLEIKNERTGRITRQLVNTQREYCFYNLPTDCEYTLRILTPDGTVLNEQNHLSFRNNEVAVVIDNLPKFSSVTLKVTTPDNTDVTNKATISWYDGENKIGGSATLSNMLKGKTVGYQAIINNELATSYAAPGLMEYMFGENPNDTITLKLNELKKIQLVGRVISASTSRPIPGASVSIQQTIDSNNTLSLNAVTDAQGCFGTYVLDREFTAIVSSTNHKTAKTVSTPSSFQSILVEPINGSKVDISIDYRSTTSNVGEIYDITANATYTITGISEGEYKIENGKLLFYDKLPSGTEIKARMSSPKGEFEPIETSTTIDDNGNGTLYFTPVEKGALTVTIASPADNHYTAFLYDSEGEFVSSASFIDGTTHFNNLHAGKYSVATIQHNPRFNNISTIASLEKCGLTIGKDCILTEAVVTDGNIETYHIDCPKQIDDAVMTVIEEGSYFYPDKTQFNINSYITLRGKVHVSPDDVSDVNSLNVIVNIPQNCKLIENSVTSNNRKTPYTVAGNNITISVYPNEQFSLCLSCGKIGSLSVTANVEAQVNGALSVEPLGSARFDINQMKLVAPSATNNVKVALTGLSPAGYCTEIYDGEIKIGETIANAAGEWSVIVDLHNPGLFSIHKLQAVIQNKDGIKLTSDVSYVEYSQVANTLVKTELHYLKDVVTFDFINNKIEPSYYTYKGQLGYYNFTFAGYWSINDLSQLKDPRFVVKCNTGRIVTIPAQIDPTGTRFIANINFPYDGVFDIPVFVTMAVDENSEINFGDHERLECEANIKGTALDEALDNLTLTDLDESQWNDKQSAQITFKFDVGEGPKDAKITTISTTELERRYPESPKFKDTDIKYALDLDETNKALLISYWNPDKELGYCLNIEKVFVDNNMSIVGKANPKFIQSFNLAYSIGNVLGSAVATYQEVKYWKDIVARERREAEEQYKRAKNRINQDTSCGKSINGENKRKSLEDEAYKLYSERLDQISDLEEGIQAKVLLETCRGVIHTATALFGHTVKAMKNSYNAANEFFSWLIKAENDVTEITRPIDGELIYHLKKGCGSLLDFAANGIDFDAIIDYGLDEYFDTNLSKQYWNQKHPLVNQYNNLLDRISKSSIECDPPTPDDDPNDPDPFGEVKTILDPSGFVYEGDASNRLENVKATVYYKSGDNDVIWDAENYGQQNPLYTDAEGRYEWYVPEGLWQVRLEKDGYQNAQSDWLPVPPPQMDVNIEMISLARPTLKSVFATPDAVTVEFDKLMIPESVTGLNAITILDNDKVVKGDLWGDNNDAKTSKFIFEPSLPITSDYIKLLIDGNVKSYADVEMGEQYMCDVKVVDMPSISLPESIDMLCGEAAHLELSVTPESVYNGKKLNAEIHSSALACILNDNIIVENGKATVSIYGSLPGKATLKISVEGMPVAESSLLNILVNNNTSIASPTASIISDSSVETGTDLHLFCATPLASIVYTIDGSNPLTSTSAIVYEDSKPIKINNDITIRAIAKNTNGAVSDEVVFRYFAKPGAGNQTIVLPTHKIVRTLNAVECEGAKKLVIYNAIGYVVNMVESRDEISISPLSPGFYIAVAYIKDKILTLKFIK